MANANPDCQAVIDGNDFDGTSTVDGTGGGKWTFGGGVHSGRQPRVKRIHFKAETSVTSWTWKLATVDRGTLAYDGQTANFTEGATLTGGTSGATALIINDVDGGATGTLTLARITGTFEDDEAITDDNGTPGAAVANGALTPLKDLLVPQGTDTEYTEFFDGDEGLIPLDHNGVPRVLEFVSVGLSGYGVAEVEWEWVRYLDDGSDKYFKK